MILVVLYNLDSQAGMFRGVSTAILAPMAFGRPFFEAIMCQIPGVTNGWFTVVIRVANKKRRSLSKEISEGSHVDELGGGIGFLCFGQSSMGWRTPCIRGRHWRILNWLRRMNRSRKSFTGGMAYRLQVLLEGETFGEEKNPVILGLSWLEWRSECWK